jgi:very-short-patch-repair endonuclease
MLKLLAPLIVLALIAVLLKEVIRGTKKNLKDKKNEADEENASYQYYAKNVMSPVEQKLYHRLRRALPNRVVLAQVGLSRVIETKDWQYAARNAISPMSLDFVICGPDSSVIAAIELDDSSHNRKKNMENDAKKNAALESAGIRLIRWHVKNMPDVETIKKTIEPEADHTAPL